MRIMRRGHTKSPPLATILWIVGSGLAIFVYSCYTAYPDYLQAAYGAMAFQVGAWTLALVMCACMSPGKDLRISDPAVLVLGWSVLYLLYPTIFWFQGNTPSLSWVAKCFSTTSAVFLMWLHGLFFLGFISGYLFFWNHSPILRQPLNIKVLPQGWLMYLLPFSPLILEILIQLSTTGEIFPTVTRASGGDQDYQTLMAVRAQGGLLEIWMQIFHKISYYLVIIQGAGVGLILTHTLYSRRNLTRNLLILGCGALFSIFFGGGERAGHIVPYLIGLIIADILVGPISWRSLAVVFGLFFLVFEFFGIFRNLRDLGFENAFYQSYETLTTISLAHHDSEEFVAMLGKEVLGIEFYRSPEGLNYLVDSCLRLIPSQIFPGKFAIPTTFDDLAQVVYGIYTEKGMGVGGAMIVDGWRFYRTLGVPLLGAIIGIIYAFAQNWLSKDARTRLQGPILFKLVLIAGFYGFSYHALRADLFAYIFWFFYLFFLPWIVFVYVSRGHKTIWSAPINLKKLA